MAGNKPKCGLCGKSKKLTKTPCCNNWVCDDAHTYVPFSYARNSCYRNHDRYTLCSYHFKEEHKGIWQNCETCKNEFDTINYTDFGTGACNFEELPNPEKISVSCTNCGFTSDSLKAFPLQTSKGNTRGYYCAKKKCQEAGFPHRNISCKNSFMNVIHL